MVTAFFIITHAVDGSESTFAFATFLAAYQEAVARGVGGVRADVYATITINGAAHTVLITSVG